MINVLKYFLAIICVQLICTLAITTIWAHVTGNSDMTAMKLITASSVSNVITIALFTLMKWTPFSRQFMQSRPWSMIYWSVIIGLGMIIPLQGLEELIPEDLTQDLMGNEFRMILGNSWGYLAVGLLAPFAEELVFRGAIQKTAIAYFEEKFATGRNLSSEATSLRQNMPHWIGIILSAMLFAALHGNPAQIPHAMLAGLILGWLCYRTGSIVPGVIVHWVNNTAAYLLYALYPQSYDMTLSDFFGGSAVRVSLAILFSMMLFVPAIFQMHVCTRKGKA